MGTRYQQLSLEDRCTIARLHGEGRSLRQEKIHKTVLGIVKIPTQPINLRCSYFYIGFKSDIGGTMRIVKKPPTRFVQQAIELDPRRCFLRRHLHHET